MDLVQILTTLLVAAIGASAGAFGFAQFMIKRKDEKEEKDIQKQIDDSINKKMNEFIQRCGDIGDAAILTAKNEMRGELEEGLKARSDEGKERFEINSKQINKNTDMIKEVLTIQRETNEKFNKLAESLTALNESMVSNSKVTRACAEGMRSTTYDRILLVAGNALKREAITITEKTNLRQLYSSWQELQGKDDKITTIIEDCMKLKTILDEDE